MFPMQEVAGNLVDVCNGDAFVPVGAVTYGNAVANWRRKFVGIPEAASAKAQAPISHLWNQSCQSLWFYSWFVLVASGGTRYLYDLGGTNMFVQTIANGHLRTIATGHQIDGVIDYRDGLVHPLICEVIGGDNMTGHAGAGIYRISTDKEQITNTWLQFGDDVKGIGALAAGTAANAKYGRLDCWVGSKAEAWSAIGAKAFLQGENWVVTGY